MLIYTILYSLLIGFILFNAFTKREWLKNYLITVPAWWFYSDKSWLRFSRAFVPIMSFNALLVISAWFLFFHDTLTGTEDLNGLYYVFFLLSIGVPSAAMILLSITTALFEFPKKFILPEVKEEWNRKYRNSIK
jgi:hypothetical protein